MEKIFYLLIALPILLSSCVNVDELDLKSDKAFVVSKEKGSFSESSKSYIRTSDSKDYIIRDKSFYEDYLLNDSVWISYYVEQGVMDILDSSYNLDELKSGEEVIKGRNDAKLLVFWIVVGAALAACIFTFYQYYQYKRYK